MRLSSHFISALLLAISSAAVSNVAAQDLFVGNTTANNTTNLTFWVEA